MARTLEMPETDGRTIAELKAADTYSTYTLKSIEGGSVSTKEGTGFFLSGEHLKAWEQRSGKRPEAGMEIRVYSGPSESSVERSEGQGLPPRRRLGAGAAGGAEGMAERLAAR